MLPRFWMADRCFTSTPWRAIILAPRARLTLRMTGRSSGLRPTASAIEKSSVSIGGRPSSVFTANTRITITSMAIVRRWPKRRTPRSNEVSGGRSERLWAMSPKRVERPVATTTPRAAPPRTLLPRKAQLLSWASGVVSGKAPARLSAGKLSPVSTASLMKRSFDSRITRSAGTRLPAESSTMSPGTISRTGNDVSAPSRSTTARGRTRDISASASFWARNSREKPTPTLAARIDRMIAASTHSRLTAEVIAANTSSSNSGLRSWLQSTPRNVGGRCSSSTLNPWRRSRACASGVLRPVAGTSRRAKSSVGASDQ